MGHLPKPTPLIVLAIAAIISTFLFGATAAKAEEPVDYNRDIRPILSDKCFLCHGPDAHDRQADLRLDVEADAHDWAIVPGSLDESEVWLRVATDDADLKMPPVDLHKDLSSEEIDLIRRWILEGAKYEDHWSFRPVKEITAPPVEDDRFRHHPIDAFIFHQLMAIGLSPSDEAAREVLIRRVTLDLTGLPPTIEEIDAFLNDTSENAYEKVVDRLLASPRYGERMAVDWMDVARYGDTSVFHADGPRDMWRWRDWVVDAYNNNMAYDDFTIKQLAGDLLPEATVADKIASGFNRNNATTDEGGVIAEEFRVEYAVDRVKTTSLVWLGLSMECAQCHDHKYDPITMHDYYRMYAFFNQAADPGMQTRNGNQAPIVDVPDETKLAQVPIVESEIASATTQLEELKLASTDAFEAWTVTAANESDSPPEPSGLVTHYELDGAEEGQVSDLIVDDAIGKLQGDFKFQEGRHGNALQTSQQVFVNSPMPGEAFERTDSFSYGCWVRSEGNPSGAPIARMHDGNRHRGWDLYLQGKGQVAAHIIHAWPGNAIKVSGPGDLKPKTWHHVMATYDGSSKSTGLKIYVDGHLIETKPEQDGLTKTIKTEIPFTIGRRTSGSTFNGLVDDVRIYDRELTAQEVGIIAQNDPAKSLLAIKPSERTPEQQNRLHEIYLERHNDEYVATSKQLLDLQTKLEDLKKPLTSVMVMSDVPKMRETFVLMRGQYDSPDKAQPVSAGVPDFLPAFEEGWPANRLGLARWIVASENPLTARVTVNRYWKMFFGTGLVKTVEDFGAQGEWPSHPELLDWMADDFVKNDWDVKRLVKQIVMSQTYRQSSRVIPEHLEIDPGNRYFARGPRFRLAGEFIRDQALAISGLMNGEIGGPGVKPYQPPGLWNEVSLNGGLRFKQDSGEKLYRRSLYTYWKRSAPPPSMTIFDAPTREQCTVRRGVTNTPLQALVLMNDPQFVEASRIFAERIMREGGETNESKIVFAFRNVTARNPSTETTQLLNSIFESERDVFVSDLDRATSLLSTGEMKRDESLSMSDLAAWTIIASLLLNLDEAVTRG